ncbi:hypothetical protein C2G38_2032665 [Gigaspora rosea]|uniref:Uncharacterized protein n=1 Tax=Gigaspora rosea TaxID=44941 RepID=A0A397VNJ8_9GLOM|nr:hypothetical protein C2G38_2032665 [Gigaspora rosea]
MPQWQNLDVTWISCFFEVAEEVEPDSISVLREMIKSEHKALNFERFWTVIISEFEKKNEIYHYEATRKQLLLDLSIIDDKIKMAKEELAKIFNTNNVQSEINLISSQNSKNENNTNSGTISDLDFETSKSHQNRERIPTLTRDDINELGIENLSISKDEKSLTTSTQKDNAHNIYNDTIVDLGIRTSGTSQADESVNTSTQDDDSHNASNNTTISLGIRTLGTSQADESINISTQDNDSHNANNYTIINLGVSSTRKAIETSNTQDNASNDELGIGTSSTSQRNNNHANN